MTEPWVYPLVALAIGHLIATIMLYHWLDRSDSAHDSPVSDADTATEPDNGSSPDTDAVVCLQCGAENDPGYRYCRQCVADLGTGQSRQTGGSGPDSPWMR